MLYVHGGGYVLGSAQGFSNFAGQIAARTHVDTFVPDYRLAPEHPFPAAINDVAATYYGLVAKDDAERIVVVGDSAGGGLTLALLSILRQREDQGHCATGWCGGDVALDRSFAHQREFSSCGCSLGRAPFMRSRQNTSLPSRIRDNQVLPQCGGKPRR